MKNEVADRFLVFAGIAGNTHLTTYFYINSAKTALSELQDFRGIFCKKQRTMDPQVKFIVGAPTHGECYKYKSCSPSKGRSGSQGKPA